MIFLTSDTHFSHRGILVHCKDTRPYESIDQMNEAMIANWNYVVGRNDTVYHLGDFGFKRNDGGEDLASIFSRLNGIKHLVFGNHDEKNKPTMDLPWVTIKNLMTLKSDGIRAELCHYPLHSWKGSWRGALMLHGHCHGGDKHTVPHRFDVGVDVWNKPMPLQHFVDLAARQTFQPVDYHGDM